MSAYTKMQHIQKCTICKNENGINNDKQINSVRMVNAGPAAAPPCPSRWPTLPQPLAHPAPAAGHRHKKKATPQGGLVWMFLA